ncbi:MAG: MAPEG family protein [Allorhizobium sp.]
MLGYEIFWPMVAQAFLVFGLYTLLIFRRSAMVRAGRIDTSDFRENRSEREPAESLVVKNCIANQFELPVLFYAASILLYLAEADSLVAVVLAWLFVVARYCHAYVHVTSNRLSLRAPLFAASFAALVCLWIWLVIWMAFS